MKIVQADDLDTQPLSEQEVNNLKKLIYDEMSLLSSSAAMFIELKGPFLFSFSFL